MSSPVEEEGFLPLAQIMPNLANVVNSIPVYEVQRAAQCSLCAKAIGAAEPHFVCVQCGHNDEDDDDEDEDEDDAVIEGANAKSAPHAHCVACEYAPALASKVGSAALAHPHVCYFVPAAATAAQLTALTVSKDEVWDPKKRARNTDRDSRFRVKEI
jgi:hypothetical protein